MGRRMVLDQEDHEAAEAADVAPGSDPGEEPAGRNGGSRRLMDLARQAEKLAGDKDAKVTKAVSVRLIFAGGIHQCCHPERRRRIWGGYGNQCRFYS